MRTPAHAVEGSVHLTVGRRPDLSEAAPYYHSYLERVPVGEICVLLTHQRTTVLAYLRGLTEEQSRLRYAADKWSVREVVESSAPSLSRTGADERSRGVRLLARSELVHSDRPHIRRMIGCARRIRMLLSSSPPGRRSLDSHESHLAAEDHPPTDWNRR